MLYIILLIVLTVCVFCYIYISKKYKTKPLHTQCVPTVTPEMTVVDVLTKAFVRCEDFERNWIISAENQVGLKYDDRPGCYVLLIFDEPVTDGNFGTYRDVYVGQSKKMFQRVHNHLNGSGNGDVYADLKYGKHVYVSCVPCSESELNKIEKDLIKRYDALQSYNETRGGSASR